MLIMKRLIIILLMLHACATAQVISYRATNMAVYAHVHSSDPWTLIRKQELTCFFELSPDSVMLVKATGRQASKTLSVSTNRRYTAYITGHATYYQKQVKTVYRHQQDYVLCYVWHSGYYFLLVFRKTPPVRAIPKPTHNNIYEVTYEKRKWKALRLIY